MKPPHRSLPVRVIPKKNAATTTSIWHHLTSCIGYRAGFDSMAAEAGISVLITNHSGTAGPQR